MNKTEYDLQSNSWDKGFWNPKTKLCFEYIDFIPLILHDDREK
jgi:hypothetical protein